MTTQLAPDRLALPPPLDMDLVDAGRVTGWIAGNVVGFRGFGDETEAAHAASVAHRTLARRLARSLGTRPVPIDIEPLTLRRVDGREMVLASGRPIAALIRPGPDSRSGTDSFGFELSIPTPIIELEVRAVAYLVYRTLRRSGIRWAMWRAGTGPAGETSAAQASVAGATEPIHNIEARTSDVAELPSRTVRGVPAVLAGRDPRRRLTKVALTVLPLAAAAVLAVGVAAFVTPPLAAVLSAGMGAGGVMLLRRRRLR